MYAVPPLVECFFRDVGTCLEKHEQTNIWLFVGMTRAELREAEGVFVHCMAVLNEESTMNCSHDKTLVGEVLRSIAPGK